MVNLNFSFDDNHILNMRVADLLEKYGFRGTFFINIIPLGTHPGMEHEQIKLLHDRGHEIAAHTYSHTSLPRVKDSKVRFELMAGKNALEELIGSKVAGFSYPKGQFTRRIQRKVMTVGYLYARVTGEGSISETNHYAIVPTIQIYNSPLRRYLRIKKNLLENGKFSWTGDWKRSAIKYIKNNEGTVHIWGHAWEIEKQELWDEFEDLLKWIKDNRYESVLLKEVLK